MTPEGQQRLIRDEGLRIYLYDDKTGAPVGRLPSGGNATIGIGRNLARGISTQEAQYLFNNDITEIETNIDIHYPWLKTKSPIVYDICVMISFNTGKLEQFVNMLTALKNDYLQTASIALMDSDAARMLPARYGRMKDAMIVNHW
jgi:hypothetical protein